MGLRDNRRKETKIIMRHYNIQNGLLPCPKCKGEVLLRECVTSNRKTIKCYDCNYILTSYSDKLDAFNRLVDEFYEAK